MKPCTCIRSTLGLLFSLGTANKPHPGARVRLVVKGSISVPGPITHAGAAASPRQPLPTPASANASLCQHEPLPAPAYKATVSPPWSAERISASMISSEPTALSGVQTVTGVPAITEDKKYLI